MEFVEKSLFSQMALCFVNPVGCHVTADHLHMPHQAFFFLLYAIFAAYTNEFIHNVYVIMFHIILNKLWPFHVFSFHHFPEMCACAISLHINVINIGLLSHHSYHTVLMLNSCTVLQNNIQ